MVDVISKVLREVRDDLRAAVWVGNFEIVGIKKDLRLRRGTGGRTRIFCPVEISSRYAAKRRIEVFALRCGNPEGIPLCVRDDGALGVAV